MRLISGLSLAALAVSAPAVAQDAAPAAEAAAQPLSAEEQAEVEAEARRRGEILVVATRIKGQLDVPQTPLQVLNEADIAAYGATSLNDLLSALGPQTGSGRGRGGGHPIVLLNGQRVSSFREMRNIPPEAFRRMEILPEEVALRFGFPADQRVVNMILKDDFSAFTAEIEHGQPQRGGTSTEQYEASLFRTAKGGGRLNLTGTYSNTTPLTEAERAIFQSASSVPSVATDPDPAAARTLIARSTDAVLNGTWATGLGEKGLDGSLSLNATIERSDRTSYSGYNTLVLTAPSGASATRSLGDPLARTNRTVSVQGGASFNKPLGGWQFTQTLDASHSDSDTRIDRRADGSALIAAAAAGTLAINGPLPALAYAGADRALQQDDSLTTRATLVGRPMRLPAGEVSLTLHAGYAYTGITAQDSRSGSGQSSLRRNDLFTGINLGLPLTSRNENVLGAIGNLTLNLSAGIDHLSDFGTIRDWSAGLTWGLTEKLGLQASYIYNESPPELASLGSPATISFNVPVYDFTRGETALVTVTGGGNPALSRETRRDLKLGLNWQLPVLRNSSLLVEYFRNRSRDVTSSFPLLTPAIEAAFPGRVTRDGAGRLIAIDRRPITLARQDSSRLRYGINLGGTIGKANAMGGGGRGPGGGGGGGGMHRPAGGGMGMMGMGPGGPGGQGRWNLSLFHTVQFSNRVLIARAGGTVLDLLDGDALSGGGVARHSLEFEGGAMAKGIGLRLNGNYSAPTRVKGSGLPGSSDLRFGAVAKFNLRLFMDLGQQKWIAEKSDALKGARVMLKLDNIFDQRQRVTDASGAVPLNYQPELFDPAGGRFIGVELRKQF